METQKLNAPHVQQEYLIVHFWIKIFIFKWIVSDIPGKFVYKKEHNDTAAWYMILYVNLTHNRDISLYTNVCLYINIMYMTLFLKWAFMLKISKLSIINAVQDSNWRMANASSWGNGLNGPLALPLVVQEWEQGDGLVGQVKNIAIPQDRWRRNVMLVNVKSHGASGVNGVHV